MRLFRQSVFSGVFVIQAIVLLGVGLWIRTWMLGTAPGVSGDEADVWARLFDFIHGNPVTWECPTGKSISPLYIATLFPFEVIFPRSFVTLRLPGVFFGLLTAFLSFHLSRRLFGNVVGVATGMVAFALPMHLVYSRLFIEQSLMGLTVLLSFYYALQGRSLGTLGWYGAALLLHPVDVFVTPMILAAYFHHLYFESAATSTEKYLKSLFAVLAGLLGVAAIVWYVPADAFNNTWNHLRRIDLFPSFLYWFVRIFSGVTPVEDVSGALPSALRFTLDVLAFGGGGLVLVLGARQLVRRADSKGLVLFGAWAFCLLLFYVVGGFIGVRPGLQRHSLFLMVPTIWVLVICGRALVSEKQLLWGSTAISWVFLLVFGYGFLWHFNKTGGTSHTLYQSAEVEPKKQVYDYLAKVSKDNKIRVLAEDWWVFHPVRYLAMGSDKLEMAMMFHLGRGLPWDQVEKFLESGGYALAWRGGRLEKMLEERLGMSSRLQFTVENQGARPLLQIWKIEPTSRLVSPLG
ncbi:MAG: hypothetical protein H6617_08990 [Bdellovibrionaceae bacterium]|nr:hypothetical protein [Bdellovibrionales bacterium]MCB9254803.1 hypothetical protein [Pseudobdellovibrionaceae bacterium]